MSNTPNQSTKALCDPMAVVQTVQQIVGEGTVTELRALDAVIRGQRGWPYTASGYFDDANKLAEAVGNIASASGIYFVPNPVKPALLSRAHNRIRRAPRGESTQDDDILRRRWFLIDMDAQRPSGISATDAEHEAAIKHARLVFSDLKAAGWPDPIVADSGNGSHLLYQIDLPNDDDGLELVKRCLGALAGRFDDEAVKIDQTVSNAGRIWKLYGTLACKGDDTQVRPHRMSSILHTPNEVGVAPRELLEALAAEAAEEQPCHARRHDVSRNGRDFDLPAFIERNGLDVQGPESWDGRQGRGQRWILQTSPMCEHDDEACYIIQHASGAISAGCHHDSCSWTWGDLRGRLEPTSATPATPSEGTTSRNLRAPREPVLVCLADVAPKKVCWLWPGRIARGALTLFAGDPDKGKSLLTIDIASRVSRGASWPDNSGNMTPRGSVILLSAEDDLDRTIRPRLDAAGADVSSVHALEAVKVRGKSGNHLHTVDLARDLAAIEAAIRGTPNCCLLVVDPISAYMGGTDSHKNADVRGLLTPLVDLAQRYDVAVVAVTHLNKSEGKVMHRSMGSVAFVAAARAAWAVAEDKTNEARRLFLPMKNNLAPNMYGLAYRIESTDDDRPFIVWEEGVVRMSADDALGHASGGQGSTAVDEAVEWLQHTLADGRVPAKQVKDRAVEDGIPLRTLDRAKKVLGVKSAPDGFGGPRVWRLPGSPGNNSDSPQSASQESLAHSDETGALCTDVAEPAA